MNGHKHNPAGHPSESLDELFEYRGAPLKKLILSIGITLVGMAVEIVGGLLSGSIALLSDAGHMFTHLFALGISAVAMRLAGEKPCHHRTFGWLRAEVLAAYTNALFLVAVTALIGYEAVARILHPEDILVKEMLIVAAIGLVVNVASIFPLHGHGGNINIRSAVAHMLADTLSSVAIVVGALIMAVTNWRWIDPVLSLGIAGVILIWAWRLFRDTSRILLEVAPTHVTTDDVEAFITQEYPTVAAIKRVRIWSITEGVTSFTAEIQLASATSENNAEDIRNRLARGLKERFGFTETTIEIGRVERR